MITITIPASEQFDEHTNSFIYTKKQTITLEHSLVAISKWESKWEKPFLSTNNKTFEETIDYIRCMTITQNVDPNVYRAISSDNILQINNYIQAKMTATTVNIGNKKASREIITSELIYYWMITLGIPFECQRWHLNRLLMLIQVCSVKNAPSKKMSKNEIMQKNRALNAARRKRLGTHG